MGWHQSIGSLPKSLLSFRTLWTDLNCGGEDKTHVYLKHSKYLPVNLSLYTEDRLPPYHTFKIIHSVIGRLGSLSIEVARPKHLQGITDHLSPPAPLLKVLSIRGGHHNNPRRNPVLPPALLAEISLRCTVCPYIPFAPNYLGETWSISHHSNCIPRCQVKLPSGNFLTSLKEFLAFAKSSSTSQPQTPVLKMDGWCHLHV